jgi:hypothetical protein
VADLHLQPERTDPDCRIFPYAAGGGAVTGGPRISNSDSPIPGGGDDYTQQKVR